LRRPPVADATSSVNSKRSRGGSNGQFSKKTTPLNNSFSSEGSQPARKKINQALFRSSTKRSRNRQEKNDHKTDTDSDASTTDDGDDDEDGQNGLSDLTDLTGSITSRSNNSTNVRSTSSTSKESNDRRRRSRSDDHYKLKYKLLREQLKDAKMKNTQEQKTISITAIGADRPIEETQQQTTIPDGSGVTMTQTAATSTSSQHALPPGGQLPPQQSAPHPMIPATILQYQQQQPPCLIQQMHQQPPGVAMVVGPSHTTIGGSAQTLSPIPGAGGLGFPMVAQQGVQLHQPAGSFLQYQQCPQSNGLVQVQTHQQPTATVSYSTVPSGLQLSGQQYNVFYH
jgi:hypothetical protein